VKIVREHINEEEFQWFKGPSEEKIKTAFEKLHPLFVEIAKEYNDGDYNLDIGKDSPPSAYFIISVTAHNKEYIFYIGQLGYKGHENPSIAFLDKSKASHDFGGVFTNHKRVYTMKNVKAYIDYIINDKNI
jgi:hypothetical protein